MAAAHPRGRSPSPHSYVSSISDDEDGRTEAHIADMITNERMYYVLSQFLETEENKNVATVLEDIAVQLKRIADSLSSSKK